MNFIQVVEDFNWIGNFWSFVEGFLYHVFVWFNICDYAAALHLVIGLWDMSAGFLWPFHSCFALFISVSTTWMALP